jgi:hypothetical protein
LEPVINALFKNGKVLNVQIAFSKNIIQNKSTYEFIFPENAEIRLYENNFELDYDIVFNNDLYTLSSLNLKPEIIYRIEIELPECNTLSAESSIPISIKLDSIIIRKEFETDPESNEISAEILKGTVLFRDNENQDYYMLQLEAYDYIFGNYIYDWKNDFFWSSDPIAIYANYQPQDIRALVFSDNLFNGGLCELDFEMRDGLYSPGVKDSTVLVCKLYTLSEDLYQYLISYHAQYISNSCFIYEPINVYSNIENGWGIFAGYSLDTLSVTIK